jgi:hypothetical protein
MTNEEVFNAWCPAEGRWTTWAKPVLFAQPLPLETESRRESPAPPVTWAPAPPSTAIVIDLPGVQSIQASLALAHLGYQPVPLFNCCSAPEHEVLPTALLRESLVLGAAELRSLRLSPLAPPTFLLDSDRLTGKVIPHPNKFDNRWLTFPQDFPSAAALKEAGISRVILFQMGKGQPLHDLAHVLIGWQEEGVPISIVNASAPDSPVSLVVTQPPRLRWFFQRTMALFGFMRNSAGGFGSVIPVPGGGTG